MNKRGRPKHENGRDKQIHVRASEECIKQLDYLVDITGESKTEIVEKAIRIKYNLHRSGSNLDEK